jgi:hypothetical protein
MAGCGIAGSFVLNPRFQGDPPAASLPVAPVIADLDRAMFARSLLRNDLFNGLRYASAAPFSKVSAAKMRWRQERTEWESLGIAQTDMRRKTYVVPETDAVCITVSKCANTTLKFMLGPATMAVPRNVHANDHLLTRLIDRGLTLNDLLDGSHNLFTFTRHPVSRFWSGYFMVENSERFGNFAHNIRAAMSVAVGAPAKARFSPELALDYVRKTLPIDVDEHFRPQWSCTGIEKLPINFIGRVETMADDVAKLFDMGYLDRHQVARLHHLNRNEKRAPPDKARIDRIIRDVYAKDFELFGYD